MLYLFSLIRLPISVWKLPPLWCMPPFLFNLIIFISYLFWNQREFPKPDFQFALGFLKNLISRSLSSLRSINYQLCSIFTHFLKKNNANGVLLPAWHSAKYRSYTDILFKPCYTLRNRPIWFDLIWFDFRDRWYTILY